MSSSQQTHPFLKEVKALQKECANQMKETIDTLDEWCKKQLADVDKKHGLIQKEKSNLVGVVISNEDRNPELEHFLGNIASIPLKDWTTIQLNELLKRISEHHDKLMANSNAVIAQTDEEKNQQNMLIAEMEKIQAKNLEAIQNSSISLDRFQKYFGLSIQKIQGGARFCFTKINKKNPKQEFYFSVVPLASNPSHYQIIECVPMVDYSEILENFNKDEFNFQQFMIQMRILFCGTVS